MFDQQINPKKKASLAKIAAILAATAGISFGLCTVGAITGSAGDHVANIVAPVASVFGGICVLSILGLICVGIVAIIKALVYAFRDPRKN
jgi:hypothetical protein